MEKIVIDSNIVFSSLISPNSKIRRTLLLGNFDFYCPNFLSFEIFKYKEKLLAGKNATSEDLHNCYEKILHRVKFVNEGLISIENILEAHYLCKDIDPKDTPFVALSFELDCRIWSKDEALINGLKAKGFDRFLGFEELL